MAVRLDKGMILSSLNHKRRVIIKGIISMLSEVPLTVIAQGADDDETLQILMDVGCEMIEGEAVKQRKMTLAEGE